MVVGGYNSGMGNIVRTISRRRRIVDNQANAIQRWVSLRTLQAHTPCRSRIGLFLLSLFLLVACSQCTAAQSVEDQLYVESLMTRGYLSLAQQYCETRIETAAAPDEIAAWHMQLTACMQQQAWRQQGQNRKQLIVHAVERITELQKLRMLNGESSPNHRTVRSLSPIADFLLRIRQLELLVDAGNMQVIVQQAGHWYRSPGVQLRFAKDNQGISYREEKSKEDFFVQSVRSVTESSHALLDQLDQNRNKFDSKEVRMLRDRLKLLAAQASFYTELNSTALAVDADTTGAWQGRFQDAEAAGLSLMRTTNDAEIRWSAGILATQIYLHRNDWPAFELRCGSLQNERPSPRQAGSLTQQQILAMLRQGRPTDALAMLQATSPTAEIPFQTRRWLKCESLLAMFALVQTLGDEQVASAARKELQQQIRDAKSSTNGVWRECIDRIADRFQRVEQVGSELADILESVDLLAESGHLPAARAALSNVMKSLPNATRIRVRASLSLKAGDLAVRAGDWDSATQNLDEAIVNYNSVQDKNAAAAADILRVFAVGRQWASSPEKDRSSPAGAESQFDEGRLAYVGAIERHLQTYADQSSAATARRWLIQLQKSTDPVSAARNTLLLPETDPTGAATAKRLIEAGNLLLDSFVRTVPGESRGDVVDLFCEKTKLLLQESKEPANADASGVSSNVLPSAQACSILEFQLLWLSIFQPSANTTFEGNAGAWNWLAVDQQLNSQAADLRDDRDQQWRFLTLKLYASARARLDTAQVQDCCDALVSLDFEELRNVLTTFQLLAEAERRNQTASASGSAALKISEAAERSNTESSDLSHGGQPLTLPGDVLLSRSFLRLASGLLSHGINSGKAKNGGDESIVTIADVLTFLPSVAVAASVTGDNELLNQLLSYVLSERLSDHQIELLANAIGNLDSTSVSPQDATVARTVWTQVLARSKQGSNPWLEASLQLARLNAAEMKQDEAKRILNVVEVLYPDWGSSERKHEASNLRKLLADP